MFILFYIDIFSKIWYNIQSIKYTHKKYLVINNTRKEVRGLKKGFTMVESIVETYHSENGEYPEELSVLVEDYLERNPSNPFTGEVDGYELVVEGDEFEVRLKNGR